MHVRDFDPNTAPVAELIAEILRLRSDLALIGAEFVKEAYERDWCGDYDQWARIMNRQLTRPWFIDRKDMNHNSEYDRTLDESDQFATAAAPAPAGTWCAACGEHH